MPTRAPAPILLGYEFAGSTEGSPRYAGSNGSWDINAGLGGHYGYPDFPLNRNVGGTFLCRGDKISYDPVPVGTIWRGGALNQHYTGSITATTPSFAGNAASGDGSARGAEAFAKMRPEKPIMDLSNSIIELKDLKDMFDPLVASRETVGSVVGSQYLAYKFGWAPIFNDIVNFFEARNKVKKKIDFLLRNNGKPVRTSIQLAELTSDPVVSQGGLYTSFMPGFVTQYYVNQPRSTDTWIAGERWWASARWQIHLPNVPGNQRDLANELYARLYGHYVTLASVYKLIPWSWLVDWFFNTNYLLQNLEASWSSRTAADYCYIMRHNFARRQLHVEGDFRRQTGEIVHVSSTSVRENFVKSRVGADPFGFSTNQNSLNSTQLAILGALGLSKVR